MTISDANGKTTYTDADSLSGDLREKVHDGDKDALKKLREFAETADPKQPHSQARALYELAEVYFNGFCEVERSPQQALKFLVQAAELDDDLASIRLGEFYRDGKQGFMQGGQKALELFIKAAEHGNKNGWRLKCFATAKAVLKPTGTELLNFTKNLTLSTISEHCWK